MEDGSATLLEVQTMGEDGLRFRHRLNGSVAEWSHLPAINSPQFLDSCGAGDWCSAGLLSKVALTGLAGLRAKRLI